MALTINVIAGGGVRHCVTFSCKTQNPPQPSVKDHWCLQTGLPEWEKSGTDSGFLFLLKTLLIFLIENHAPELLLCTKLLSSFCINFWPSKQSSEIYLSPNAILYFMKQQTSCYFVQYTLLLVDQCSLIKKTNKLILF